MFWQLNFGVIFCGIGSRILVRTIAGLRCGLQQDSMGSTSASGGEVFDHSDGSRNSGEVYNLCTSAMTAGISVAIVQYFGKQDNKRAREQEDF
jgi:hypothetical protein